MNELYDFSLPLVGRGGIELAEALEDLVRFEVESLELVIVAAALDGGPLDDARGGGPEGIAHIGLLIDFFGTGASATIGQELFGREFRAFGAIDDVDDAELDGVRHGDTEIQIPRG